jgi:hypothetical protein
VHQTRLTVSATPREGHARTALSVLIGYRQGTPMRNVIEAHDPGQLAEAADIAAAAITRQFGPGQARAKIRAHIITAV